MVLGIPMHGADMVACGNLHSADRLASTSFDSSNLVPKPTLLLTDFDKTLTDFDAIERLIEELAPDLLPALLMLEQPANYVPLTNTLLAELQQRGVSREKVLTTLQHMGTEFPAASVKLLQLASRLGIEARILSDCNTLFIGQMLAVANASQLVKEVITNTATFEEAETGVAMLGGPASHKLVITPRHGSELPPHNCRWCPENLCKGAEVRRLQATGRYGRIVYCGDGNNDICSVLQLSAGDVVLARKGYSLGNFLTKSAASSGVVAEQKLWEDHEQLLRMLEVVLP